MDSFFGLPAHPLLVHGVTVLLPLAALGAIVAAVSPTWRERIGWVASRLARAGAGVVVSAISPYEEARQRARALVEEHAPFVLVHVATSIEECERRDPKGLYARAHAGEIEGFTGVDDPYEMPASPELTLETEGATADASAAVVLARLEELGVVSGGVVA